MDTTIGLNLNGKAEYKTIADVQKTYIYEMVGQAYKHHSFELRVTLMKDVERLVKAMIQPLDHSDEAEAALASEPPKVKESYHNAAEVKGAIANNIVSIYEYFGDRAFSLSTFTDHLKSYVTLREHDYTPHLVHNRWEQQVNSAIRAVKVKGYVIESTGRRGYYAIRPTHPTPSPSS
jgi:hypothetical protein